MIHRAMREQKEKSGGLRGHVIVERPTSEMASRSVLIASGYLRVSDGRRKGLYLSSFSLVGGGHGRFGWGRREGFSVQDSPFFCRVGGRRLPRPHDTVHRENWTIYLNPSP